jgi:hypothetical protein
VLDVPTSYEPGTKMPLFVGLHGDYEVDGATYYEWAPITRAAGMILFVPVCTPAMCGPDRSYWEWFEGHGAKPHDPAWLGAQIDSIVAEYNIDETRIYFAGVSGGADYLAYWAPANYKRVAAVGYVVGGAVGYHKGYGCPPSPCKYGTYFLSGGDFSKSYSYPMYQWYQGCGDDAIWKEEDVGHAGYQLLFSMHYNEIIWSWMSKQSACDG